MAYEATAVPTVRSQEGIRKLIMRHKGNKLAFITEPPREGFAAVVELGGVPYQIRVSATMREPKANMTLKQRDAFDQQEARRIWRVLFYHLKSAFEASDAGVMDLRELLMPYIVTKSGKTIGEMILPNLDKAIETNPARLLT